MEDIYVESFQSTPPAWGATSIDEYENAVAVFQSTPPAWGATDPPVNNVLPSAVSIHAPRVGGDKRRWRFDFFFPVSIHAPRVGGDPRSPTGPSSSRCFNPRPPRGGRRGAPAATTRRSRVSIHAPRVGGDPGCIRRCG